MTASITKLEPMNHEMLKIALGQAVGVLKQGAVAVRDVEHSFSVTWKHPDSPEQVDISVQNSINLVVGPADNMDTSMLINAGSRGLVEADLEDLDKVARHVGWLNGLAVNAERPDGPIGTRHQELVDAVAALCALHPDARRVSNVDLMVESHDRPWHLTAMSNVERAILHDDLVEWVKSQIVPVETIQSYFGEDYMLSVSLWHGLPRDMSEERAREAILVLPEHLRDAIVSVEPR